MEKLRGKTADKRSATEKLPAPFEFAFPGKPLVPPPPALAPTENRQVHESAVLEGLKKLGFGDLAVTDLQKLKPLDTNEVEIALMAEVRAYFKVAYKVRPPKILYRSAVHMLIVKRSYPRSESLTILPSQLTMSYSMPLRTICSHI
jgi:hypothetical protein